MTTAELEQRLYEFIQPSYPEIDIRAEETEEGKLQLYFTEEKFSALYPQQRYHYLLHCIPDDFFQQYLSNTVWFELAPGESPEDLQYPDNETIEMIKENVLTVLNKSGFITMLDNSLVSGGVQCHGDYSTAKKILNDLGFANEEEQFDIFHVLMDDGGYCDCEILYNVFRQTEYAKNYWRNRT